MRSRVREGSLGHYEILEEIGRGGMGVVYRGRDTKLHRDVAVKVLPESLVEDRERLACLEREARVLATLNHPNVAMVHELGQSGPTRYLVMELVEGEDLKSRIARGAIPLPEALVLFRQIAEALEAAHVKGIVHRDLKPANVKVTAEGRVKVLDFGLATPIEMESVEGLSPSPARNEAATTGVIRGTASYMSPEQALGRVVDERTDIWAFGCVLYEALSGRKAFTGDTVVDTLAAVLKQEPKWTALPASTPPAVRILLRRCLRPEPRSRLHDIADARIVIEDAIETPEPSREGASRPSRIGWLVAVLSGSALVVALAASFRGADSADVARLSIVAPRGTTFGIRPSDGGVEPAVVSPDGKHIAFVAQSAPEDKALWVRSLASGVARLLPSTRNASLPFWSPDSRHIGFFAEGKLSRIDLSGTGLRRLADVQIGYGGTWNADGVILFAPHIRSAILRVSAEGGPAEEVTLLDELDFSHRDPRFLPDGKRFLYRRVGGPEEKRGVWVSSIDEPGKDRFLGILSKVAVASGYLLYVSDGWLMAQEFDDVDLTLSGTPVTVSEERISVPGEWWGNYSVSDTGVLVYFPDHSLGLRHLVWYDRSGRRLETLGAPGYYQAPQLSPDETQVAFSSWAEASLGEEVWRWHFGEDAPRRVASDPETDRSPVWSPDGSSIVFASQRGSDPGPDDALYRYDLESGHLELLLPSLEGGVPIPKFPLQWTRDGRYILYFQPQGRQSGRYEIWALPTLGDKSPIPVVFGEADAAMGQVSPDGLWILFHDKGSDAGIFARRFPDDTGRIAVSRGFGVKPRWRADGKEIYYLAPPNLVMAVEVDAGREFRHGTPRRLFETNVEVDAFEPTPYDVTRDGQRFLFAEPIPEPPVREMRVVLNWDRALLR